MSKNNSLMVLDNGLSGSPKDIQEALIIAEPGDVVSITDGPFNDFNGVV